jgi:hypothetical protein
VCAWGDGEHTITAAAEDTGGARSTSSATVTVRADCTPPEVTVGPQVASQVSAGQPLAPTVTAPDARVAVAATEVEVQVGASGPWQPYVGPVSASAGSAYRFRARATDQLGNTSGWTTSAWTNAVLAGSATAPPPNGVSAETSPPGNASAETHLPPAPGHGGLPVLGSGLTPAWRPTQAATKPARTRPASGAKARAPKLLRQRLDRRARRLTVTGRARSNAVILLTVRVTRTGRRPARLTRRTTARRGRFTARIRVPRGTRRARVIRIRAQGLH